MIDARVSQIIRGTFADLAADRGAGETVERVLAGVLELTQSELGFVAEILRTPGEVPSFRARVISSLTWDDAAQHFVATSASQESAFSDVEERFAATVQAGELMLVNEVPGGVTQSGLSPLRSLCGIPLSVGPLRIGLIGLANRPGGYDRALIESLDTILQGAAFVIRAYRVRDARDRLAREKHTLEQRLRQADKMQSLGQLIGGISHDFNNILASVIGYAGLSSERVGSSDPLLAEWLGEIDRAGQRGRELVARMLAFSRTSSPNRERLDLGEEIRRSLALLTPMLPSSLRVHTRAGPLLADVDPVSFEMMLMNLIVNARDATLGHGTVEIRPLELEASGGCDSCGADTIGRWSAVEVADDGPGIPELVRHRVFEPFFTTKAASQGTGMGLAIVHGVVHSHGGHVQLVCPPGGGTVVRLLLPCAERAASSDGASPTPLATRATDADCVRGRIAVVDDEPGIAALIREALSTGGHSVEAFSSSEAVLAAIARDAAAFDLLITDQTMPGLTGASLVSEVRRIRPDLPVIVATGFSDAIDEYVVASWGNARLLQKPVSLDALRRNAAEMLREALRAAP